MHVVRQDSEIKGDSTVRNSIEVSIHTLRNRSEVSNWIIFADNIGEMAQALRYVGQEEAISLYVHIPYCQQICWYCGCNTGAAGKAQRLASYLSALEAEMATIAKMLNGRGLVKHIAFGGGLRCGGNGGRLGLTIRNSLRPARNRRNSPVPRTAFSSPCGP